MNRCSFWPPDKGARREIQWGDGGGPVFFGREPVRKQRAKKLTLSTAWPSGRPESWQRDILRRDSRWWWWAGFRCGTGWTREGCRRRSTEVVVEEQHFTGKKEPETGTREEEP